MNPSRLPDVIIVQESIRSPDGAGGYIETWQDKMIIPAKVQPLRSRKLFQAQQVQSEITHEITIRYTTNIKDTDRVIYNNQIFELEGPPININNENRYLELLCIGGDKLG